MLPSGTVTFLFTDIEDSTQLWEKQPAAMSVAHAKHDQVLRTAIESNHGYIFQIVGDSFSAAFPNALDGVHAAVSAQLGLADEYRNSALTIKVRMGLHTGTAQIQDNGTYDGYVTLASTQRVMSVAYGGQILLSHTTNDLLPARLPENISRKDLGEHQLKSLRAPLRLYQLVIPDLPEDFPPIHSLSRSTNNLPIQLTSFIGREREKKEACDLLTSTRLLTLIGPGGTGKTRLSLELASEQIHGFKDGAWLVELAAITDPANIPGAIASVFGLQEAQGLSLMDIVLDYLRAKQLLLILDNCEHLVEATARVTDQILHVSTQVKILASSREALGIPGETVYRVPSLKETEATRLFVERASKADSRFQLTRDNSAFITQICTRLDGIPLAIELAAARVKLFSPQQIAERLDDRFKLLTGGSRTALPRQQTLHALIDWSYQTLNETEQRTLRRLAVFAGGWTFEAAESVIGEEAYEGLAGLVNKSLVNVEDQGNLSRYFLLETIHQYAMEKLVEAGEANSTRTRHLDYYLKFMRSFNPYIIGVQSLQWYKQIENEPGNLRTALEWAANKDIEKAIQLILQLGGYWINLGSISESLFWYNNILEKSGSLSGHTLERGKIYAMQGWAFILLGRHREGRAAVEEALRLAKTAENIDTWIFALCTLTLASVFLNDFDTAQNAIQEAERLARQSGFKPGLAVALSTRAQMIYFTTHDGAAARHYLDESLRLSRELGYEWSDYFQAFAQARLAASLGDIQTARAKFNEGAAFSQKIGNRRMVYTNRSEFAHTLRENGNLDEALGIYREIIPGWKEVGHRAALTHELECIAYILSRKEEPERAARLLGAANAIRRLIDTPRTSFEEKEYESEITRTKEMLGEEKFDENWRLGERLSMDESIAVAMGENLE